MTDDINLKAAEKMLDAIVNAPKDGEKFIVDQKTYDFASGKISAEEYLDSEKET